MSANDPTTHLLQLLLPLRDDTGAPFPPSRYAAIRQELTDQFGGVTFYSRAAAEGVWRDDDGHHEHDELMVCEVMVTSLDRVWWKTYRERLERAFEQEELVIRVLPIERI